MRHILTYILLLPVPALSACDDLLMEDVRSEESAPATIAAPFWGGAVAKLPATGGGGWAGTSGGYNCQSAAGTAATCQDHADYWGTDGNWYWNSSGCYYNSTGEVNCGIGDGEWGDWDCNGADGCHE